MKKILFLILTASLLGCNNEIATNISPEDSKTPDYNVILEGPAIFPWDSSNNVYSNTAALYLRPFENVRETDQVTLLVESNNLARFIIDGDTLYNGDKKALKYSDFDKFILKFGYESQVSGSHTMSITTTIKKVSKKADITFSTSSL